MNKEEILKLVVDHKDSFVQIIKARDKAFHLEVSNGFEGRSFSEKLYKWSQVGNDLLGKCKLCTKETKFLTFGEGYRPYCSTKCANVASAPDRSGSRPMNMEYWEEIECLSCKNKFFALKFRKQLFCSNKCSSDSTANDPKRLAKIRATKLERHGNETYVNPEKAKETCLNKYGVDNASKSPEIIEKIKQSTRLHYGIDWSWQSEEIKKKIRDTNLLRYGFVNPSQSSIIKEKVKDTVNKRYGVDNVFQNQDIKDKIYESNLEKYGAKIVVNSPEKKREAMEASKTLMFPLLIDRLINKSDVIPLFTADEYKGTYRDNRYKFQCKKCDDMFYDHIDGGHLPRCLKCDPHVAGFSYMELEFLDYLNIPDDDLHRRVLIYFTNDKKYFVDGLDIENKVIYEFLGDYYHGNSLIFEHDGYNTVCHKTFGELYQETFIRMNNLKSLGYVVKYIWESDWKQFKTGENETPKIITL